MSTADIEALRNRISELERDNERLAAAARLTEARLDAVLDALPVGIVIADAEGRIVRDNAASRELWGLPPATQSWRDYENWMGWWPDTGERIAAEDWAMARALRRGETIRNEVVLCQPFDGGARRTYINNAAPIRDAAGAIVGGVVAELDITAQRADEEQRRLLQQLVELLPDLVAVSDAGGRITYLNSSGRRLIGLPETGDMPDLTSEDFVAPSSRDLFRDVVIPTARDTGLWHGDMNLMNLANGDVFEVERSTVALRDAAGRLAGYATVTRSLTEARQAASQLRDLVATLDMGAFMTRDFAGTIRHWSAGCEQLYGWSATEAVGRRSHDLLQTVFPGSLDEVEDTLRRDGQWIGDLRHTTRDGRQIVVQANKVLRQGADGPVILEALTDVTGQRAAETALSMGEARLHTIVETVPVGLVMAELPSGRIVSGNSYVERLLGHPVLQSADIHSYGEWVSFHADGTRVESHEYPLARMVLHGEETPSIEVHYQRGDGTRRWIRIMGRQVRDREGALVGGVVALMDVDAERRAREALVASEARLRLATEAGQVGVFELGLQSEEMTWDDRLRALFGLPPGAPVTRAVTAAALPLEDKERLDKAIAESVAAPDKRDREIEYRVHPLDGSPQRILSARWRVVHDDDTPVRIVGTAVDVTLQRQAEAILARDKAELEHLVQARTAELQQAQSRLAHAQRMDALGQLAGGIAHDFNNVLHAVQGGAGLLERRANDVEKVRSLARMISEAAERGASVTRRLLAFSRRGDLRAEAIDVGQLYGGLRAMLAPALGAAIEVRIEIEPDLPRLFADKGQLETLLVNLATNARDAMPGGGTLTLSARRDSSGMVALSARDTGGGMTADVLARATEPFFTTKPRGKGTGLGLSMARGFAEQSGGGLEIESTPDGGTTVTVWFPAAATSAEEEYRPGPINLPDYRIRSERILVVDDDPAVRTVTAEQLGQAGFRVVEAERGADALSLLDSGEPVDLIVSDLSMPGMDGIAVIREARRRIAGLPAILLTGFATSAAELATGEESRERFALLRKPTSARQLVDSVSSLLQS